MIFLVVHPEEKGIVIQEIDEGMNKAEEMLRRHTLTQRGEIIKEEEEE